MPLLRATGGRRAQRLHRSGRARRAAIAAATRAAASRAGLADRRSGTAAASACVIETGDSCTSRPSPSASAARISRESARPRLCSAACSMSPASLNTATVVTLVLHARRGEPRLPQVGVAQQRLARERLGLRAEEAPRGGRRADDDDRRPVEQPLGLQARATGPMPCRTAAWKPSRRRSTALIDASISSARSRMALAPAPDAGQQPALRERRQHRDAQALRVAGRGRGCGLHAVVELRKRALHAAQQRLTGGIEHDAPPAPIEELETQVLLEPADLLAHRAVRQMQRLGGRAQVLHFGDGAERGKRVEREAGHWLAMLTKMVGTYRFLGAHWRINLTSVIRQGGHDEMPHTNEALRRSAFLPRAEVAMHAYLPTPRPAAFVWKAAQIGCSVRRQRIDAWLASRAKGARRRAVAEAMSDRELRDIGIDPARIHPRRGRRTGRSSVVSR